MPKRMPYVRFFPSDFLEGTRHLTNEQAGVYIRVLLALYAHGGRLRMDPDWLRWLLNCRPSTVDKKIRELVDLGKLSIVDGYLTNNRVIEEIADFSKSFAGNSGETPENLTEKSAKKPTNTTRARTFAKQNQNQNLSPSGDSRRAGARGPPQDFSAYLMDELRLMQNGGADHDEQQTIDGTFRRLETGNARAKDAGADPPGKTPHAKPR